MFKLKKAIDIRITAVVVLLLSICTQSFRAQDTSTEILWDNYGVPHVYAASTQEMYYAFGWAQMHNHANLILRLYGQARGRAAEYWGENYLVSDKQILLFDLPGLAAKSYMKQKKEYKSFLDAFVQGMNDYAAEHSESIGVNFKQVLPVKVTDVLAHTMRVTYLEFLAYDDLNELKRLIEPGSNAIAIAPSKSRSKNAMLLTNPHLPWGDLYLWFEAHLSCKGFNAYGISLVGVPSLTMAFNDFLGWAHTVNTIDASDRYKLTLSNDEYILDGKATKFENRNVIIKIKQSNGTIKEQTVIFQYSKQGPVIGRKGNEAYAVRLAGINNTGIFEQYHKMAKSKNFKEFESASKMLQNPMFNIIYADKSGNILYLFNGNVPERTEGDYWFWHGTIDGTKSKLIWTKTHPYEDLPKLLNPASGFIQNCNDPPWTCTIPTELDPARYPAYMSPQMMLLRPQRAVSLIRDNPSISFDQLVDYKLNTGMEAADRFLDELLNAVKKYPDSITTDAATVLSAWDRKTEVNSRGAVLFTFWWDQVRNSLFEIPWSAKDPAGTPRGLKDPKLAVELLSKAAHAMLKKYGSLDIAWGEVYRFRMNGKDLPANGGPADYGIFRTIYFTDDPDNKKHATAGDTYVAVTEFGDKVKAKVLLSYGNATQPGNKHVADQLNLLSEKKLRDALLEKSDILKNMEEKENLKMKPLK